MSDPVIPPYPDSRPIALSDKPMLDRIFAASQPRLSEFTFAGLYLFRSAHDYRLTTIGDALVILGKGYDNAPRFMPPLNGAVREALDLLFGAGLQLYGADQSFVDRYLAADRLLVTEDRDSFDYLHLRSELAELPGNRYHKKKNRISYFTARHHYQVELFDASHAAGCLALLEMWKHARGENVPQSALLEVEATAEAVILADQLGLSGVVVLVDGAVKAFALGEKLNDTTAVCHFEKSDPFIEGIAQLVDREFNRLLFTDCSRVNREQDLGEPGLRAAKLSYHPVELVKKFRAQRL